VLAYKERDPAERQLWDMMARKTGVVLERVGKQAGAGRLPVEIWLGRMKKQGRKGWRLSTLVWCSVTCRDSLLRVAVKMRMLLFVRTPLIDRGCACYGAGHAVSSDQTRSLHTARLIRGSASE